MRHKDLLLFCGWAWLPLILLAPSWLDSGTAVKNFGDLYAYHYPLRHLAASAFQSGRLPFWNLYIFGGLPLAANPQSVLFYPVALLGAFFPLTLAFSWDYAFHLLWAGLGMTLLARRMGLSTAAAALVAAVFSLSPFLVYRITEGIPTLLASLAWAPWCWLALDSRRPGLLAGAWSLQFLSGHPQFMIANALGMGIWILAQGKAGRSSLARLAGEGAAVLMLTAMQWLPTWEFVGRSVRKGWPAAFTSAYAVDLSSLWTWLHPNAWGNPLDGSYLGPPSVFFETSAVYIGALGLILAAAGLWQSRRRAGLLALLGLGVLLAAGPSHPFSAGLLRLGPLGLLRTPARYLFLAFWGLALALGGGFRWLESRARAPSWLRAGVAIAIILELLLWDRRFLRTESAGPYLGVNREIARRVGGQPLRLMTDPELANSNKAMLYRAMNVNGYEAFYLGGFPEYAARSEGRPAADPSRSYLSRYDSPEMNRMGVAYYFSSQGRLIPNPAAAPLAYFVDSARNPIRDGLSLEIESPEEWVVRGFPPPQARGVVLAQPFYPGWRAWLNGKLRPLERWDGFLQAVALPPDLPAGKTFELRARFAPSGWPLWILLASCSWAAWLGLWREGLARL